MSNEYINRFLGLVEERFSEDSSGMKMSEWVSRNTTLRNRPFSYKGYEFQKQIMDDMHPNLDCIKISQVGLTEIQIRKALAFLVRNNGTSLIFSLPNEDMYKRVSSARVKPIVNKDKVFNTEIDKAAKAVRSMDLMQFNQSFLYLVPAIESAATSIPADVVFNDELDLSDPKMISLFTSRMQNSEFKISQRFSTPSLPNFGIDLNWRVSDQHLYMCKCDSCGHHNHPEFEPQFINLPGLPDRPLHEITIDYAELLDFDNAYVMCEKCSAPLDLGNPEMRHWLASYPSRVNQRGYRIGPFSSAKLDLRYIFTSMWGYQKGEYMRGFYNTTLGQPYSDGNIQLSEEDILACMTDQMAPPNLKSYDNLWVGIDMGQTCHITIGEGSSRDNMQILSMYSISVRDLVDHCEMLVKNYNIRGGTVDRHPYEPTTQEIFKKTGGKIVPVEYRGQKEINLVNDVYEEFSHAQVNATWFLDNFATKIRKKHIRISGYGHNKRMIISHFRDMFRDEKPGEPAKWVKLTGDDHFLHSSAFMVLAIDLFDVIRLKNKDDVRTMVLSHSVKVREGTSNIPGVSNKRVDTFSKG